MVKAGLAIRDLDAKALWFAKTVDYGGITAWLTEKIPQASDLLMGATTPGLECSLVLLYREGQKLCVFNRGGEFFGSEQLRVAMGHTTQGAKARELWFSMYLNGAKSSLTTYPAFRRAPTEDEIAAAEEDGTLDVEGESADSSDEIHEDLGQ